MMHVRSKLLVSCFFVILEIVTTTAAPRTAVGDGPERGPGIQWQDWSADAFSRARDSGRRVLVYLTAAWCHACHVMETETFADSSVIEAIGTSFVPVWVDVDERPELHLWIHEDFFGLPTVLIMDAEANLLRRANGMNTLDFTAFMDPEVRDIFPSPAPREIDPSEVPAPFDLALDICRDLMANDRQDGSPWGGEIYLDSGALRLLAEAGSMVQGEDSRGVLVRWLDELLVSPIRDPVDGGFFRYARQATGAEPYYEKLLRVQIRAMRFYAAGAALTGNAAHASTVGELWAFVDQNLRIPDSPFFAVGRNADVMDPHRARVHMTGADYYGAPASRRTELLPPGRVGDAYLEENARVVSALVACRGTAFGTDWLPSARTLLDTVWTAARVREKGSFRHRLLDGAEDPAPLGGLVALGTALLDVGAATGEELYTYRALAVAQELERSYRLPGSRLYAQIPADRLENTAFGFRRGLIAGNDSAVSFLARLAVASQDSRWIARAEEVYAGAIEEGVLIEGDRADLGLAALALWQAQQIPLRPERRQ